MKLTDLDARFVVLLEGGNGYGYVDTLEEADGVMFQCPKCSEGRAKGSDERRNYVLGAHYVLCWFRDRVPKEEPPKGRWTPEGTGLHDLTFVAGIPPEAFSVLSHCPTNWHGYVKNGEATPQ